MNLIEEAWIPILRRSGTREHIAPWQLTESIGTDPVVGLDAPRPDFNGALAQLLVGLLQTAWAPESSSEWAASQRDPPTPEELRSRFIRFVDAFNLDGEGPRFFQDLELREGDRKGIAALFINAPGGSTIRHNKDLFEKRGRVQVLCPPCAATALVTLQTDSPAGGAGVRTSLRGGGPLTTLVFPEGESPLFRALWLNVLPRTVFESITGNPELTKPENTFPWLSATRTSEPKTGCETTPESCRPEQVFWGMPRRLRLRKMEKSETCDLCGGPGAVYTEAISRPHGVNYTGPWRHPLSPYRQTDSGPLPLHPQPGGIGYQLWAPLTIGDLDQEVSPAQVVHLARKDKQRISGRAHIWAFGYDMDNMKARCWYEHRMPVYQMSDEEAQVMRGRVAKLVQAAELVNDNLRGRLKEAWFKRPKDVKGDLSFAPRTFWASTETAFFDAVEVLRSTLDQESQPIQVYHQWHSLLRSKAEELFDLWAFGSDLGRANPRRVAEARLKLVKFNWGKSIKKVLMLDKAGKKTPNGGRSGSSKTDG